jgi:hypothetical protein
MAKSEIISNRLSHEMKRVSSEREPTSDERDYERIVIAELRRRLPEGEGIKSCEGFKHLFVQCCDTCHNFYRHDEMSVIDLPDGGKGRVCDPGQVGDLSRGISKTRRVEPELTGGQTAEADSRLGYGQ